MSGIELTQWSLLDQVRAEEHERAAAQAELLASATDKMDAREP